MRLLVESGLPIAGGIIGAGGGAPPAPPAAEPGVETFVIRQRIGSDFRDLYAQAHRELDRLLLPAVLEHTGGEPASGLPPAGHRPADAAPETPRPGAAARQGRGGRG